MNIMGEAAILFGVCLFSEGISAVLPFPFPGSVIGMVVLLALLLCGAVKEVHIRRVSQFLVGNMPFFFIPACIGILNYLDVLSACFLPLLLAAGLTIPLVYLVTAWVIQLLMRWGEGAQRRD